MPMFVVNTNVAKGDVPQALLSEATQELSTAMGKPVQVGRDFSNPHSLFMRVRSKFTFSFLTPPRMLPIAVFARCHRSREFMAQQYLLWTSRAN